MTFDLHADVAEGMVTQPFVETLLLNNAPYVSPSNVTSVSSTSVGQVTRNNAAFSYTGGWRMLSLVCGLTVLSMVL